MNLLQQRINKEKAKATLDNNNYDALNLSPEISALLKAKDAIISLQQKQLDALEDEPFNFQQMLLLPGEISTYKSRNDVDLHVSFSFAHSEKQASFIPVVASNMDTIGTLAMADVLRQKEMFTCLHKFHETKKLTQYFSSLKANDPKAFEYFAISTGISDQDYRRTEYIMEKNPELQYICVDVANGYMEALDKFVKKVRKRFPETTIFVGNVVDAKRTKDLIESGADAVKVGIGPGSVCTTRQEAGVGALQGSAIVDCAYGVHELGYGHIISDGGCTNAGNISQACACGADMIMLGGLLSGHKECFEGEPKIKIDSYGKEWVEFYGMSSYKAMQNHYKDCEKRMEYRGSEGRAILVEYKGPVINTVNALLGGMRSAITYTGVSGLRDLRKAEYQILHDGNNGLNLSLATKSPLFEMNVHQCTR